MPLTYKLYAVYDAVMLTDINLKFFYCFINPFQTNEISVKLHAIKSGWSVIYIEGSQVIIAKIKFLYFFL